MVRNALPKDISQLVEIYNHYIQHTTVTFEKTPVTKEDMWARVEQTQAKYQNWRLCICYRLETERCLSAFSRSHGLSPYTTKWQRLWLSTLRSDAGSIEHIKRPCSDRWNRIAKSSQYRITRKIWISKSSTF